MILVPVLTTSLIHFPLKGWENVHFELGSESIKVSSVRNHSSIALYFEFSYKINKLGVVIALLTDFL